MKKRLLRRYKSFAQFIFIDGEFNKFCYYVEKGHYHSARILLDDKMEELELQICLDEDATDSLGIYKQCNVLQDIVYNLILVNEREMARGNKVQQVI